MLDSKQVLLKGNLYLIIDLIKQEETLEKIKEELKNINNIERIIVFNSSENSLFKVSVYDGYYNRCSITGNDILAFVYYIYYNNKISKTSFNIETDMGVKEVSLNIKNDFLEKISFNMGKPILTPRLIPVRSEKNIFINEMLQIEDKTFKTTSMSFGEPHVVIIDKDIDKIDLEHFGPKIEYHPIFLKRPNVEFTEKFNNHFIYNRIWQRGYQEIDYSISDACASVAALVLNSHLPVNKDITVVSRGGLVTVNYKDEGIVVTSDVRLNKLKVKQYKYD